MFPGLVTGQAQGFAPAAMRELGANPRALGIDVRQAQ
jgi:hypothetical protein